MKKFPQIKVSVPFALLLSLLFVMDFGNVFTETLIAVLIHEIAHIIAVKLCGGTIDCVELCAFGVRVNVPELAYMPHKKEIIIAAAGPLAGIFTAMATLAAAKLFKCFGFEYFIGINLAITAINLIPVYPLDGGRICMSVFLCAFSYEKARFVCCILSTVSVFALICAFFLSLVNGVLNPSLALFSIYLMLCGIRFRRIL